MSLQDIILSVFDVYKRYNIKSFPIDCFGILSEAGYYIKKYSELSPQKKEACVKLSKDACTIGDTIYYEERNSTERVRFSLMHEFGHIVLNTADEDEADYFASNILAPRSIIYSLNCRNAEDVHATFEISYAAANRVWYDYRHRHRTDVERAIKELIFPPEPAREIIKDTETAVEIIKDRPQIDPSYVPSKKFSEHREKALARIRRQRRKIQRQLNEYEKDIAFIGGMDPDNAFSRAECQWLYGNDL